jgi:hypothetical protein
MTALTVRIATMLLALGLTVTGITLAAVDGAPPLAGPIAPFGCGA